MSGPSSEELSDASERRRRNYTARHEADARSRQDATAPRLGTRVAPSEATRRRPLTRRVIRALRKRIPGGFKQSQFGRFLKQLVDGAVPPSPTVAVEQPAPSELSFGTGLPALDEAQTLRVQACAKNRHRARSRPPTTPSPPSVSVLILGASTPSDRAQLTSALGAESNPLLRSISAFPKEGFEPTATSPRAFHQRINDWVLEDGADHLLFLSPGVEPTDETLRALSHHLTDPEIGAAAPEIHRVPVGNAPSSSLLSAGLKLRIGSAPGGPLMYELGAVCGLAQGGEGVELVPAASLACLLVRRQAFIAAGGLGPNSDEVQGGADLCLRLSARCGLGTVVDHGLHTSRTIPSAPTLGSLAVDETSTERDHQAVRLRRFALQDKIEDRRFYGDEPLRLAIIDEDSPEVQFGSDQDVAHAFRSALGWTANRVHPDSDSETISRADVVLSTSPRYNPRDQQKRRSNVLSVAWVDESPRWDHAVEHNLYDIILCATDAAQRRLNDRWNYDLPVVPRDRRNLARDIATFLGHFSRSRLRIAIKSPAPAGHAARIWGDHHFALALQRSLLRLGHAVTVDALPDWYAPQSRSADLVLVLRGVSRYVPRPDQLNFMWNISHPEDVGRDEYEAYDHVFVASGTYPWRLADLRVPVTPLLQCTDPRLFFPDPDGDLSAHRVLFVGNSRRQPRPIVMDAIQAGLPISVYGKLWDGIIDSKYVAGEHVPNEVLRRHYSSAKVVLNDHWTDMREWGFLSNRLFDAGACAACVVSDPAAGLHELFGDSVRSYETVEELRSTVETLLADDSLRRTLGAQLRELVLREHTFDRRAVQIVEKAREFLAPTGALTREV